MSATQQLDQIIRSDIALMPIEDILDFSCRGILCSTRFNLLKRSYPYITLGEGEEVSVALPGIHDITLVACRNIQATRKALLNDYNASTCGSIDYHLLGWSLVDQHLRGHHELRDLHDDDEAKSAAHHICLDIIDILCGQFDLDLTSRDHIGVLGSMIAAH